MHFSIYIFYVVVNAYILVFFFFFWLNRDRSSNFKMNSGSCQVLSTGLPGNFLKCIIFLTLLFMVP